ncbi:MAG: succinate dehydrogenase, cytochrome b556 subunit [Caulobacterales bacterium]
MADAAPGPRPRPLSPSVWIWRWHVTMLASILHRATGAALYVGALVLMGWAVSLAAGPDSYQAYMSLLGSILGKIVLFGFTVSIFYHMANGLRHLAWDGGVGFTPKTADQTAMGALAFGAVAAVIVWVIAGLTGAL